MFKKKIIDFFDALLDLFEDSNKYMYVGIMNYRHYVRNVLSESELLKNLIRFLTQPLVYRRLKEHSIQSDPENFKDLIQLLNSCNTENQKTIWKWIHQIIEEVILDNNLDIDDIF